LSSSAAPIVPVAGVVIANIAWAALAGRWRTRPMISRSLAGVSR
jgi:hypothetical protein